MIRVEYVVDTKEEFEKLKEYLQQTISRLEVSSLDVYCVEEQKTHFFTHSKLDKDTLVYYEEK